MKNKYQVLSSILILSTSLNLGSLKAQQKELPKKPNIIFILMDDLGIGDVGVFFQNQRRLANQRNKPFTITPYLDEMAKNGAQLDQYCAAPVCAPSRASILLGQSQGHANVRDNQFDKALDDNYTLGNVMQLAGYKTVAIGKWGLQGTNKLSKDSKRWPAAPMKRGFDYYFGYIRHSDGHEHYPKEGVYRGKKEVYDGEQDVSKMLDKCYTGDLFTAKAKQYIINHEKGEDKNKPFMMYLAYDTPHAVLELPTQAYPSGFGLKGGLQWTGKPGEMINTATGIPDSWMDPEYLNATYDNDNEATTPEVVWPDPYKRYATITKRIDNQVHDVLQLLKDLHIDNNTLVVFTSDNGPSIESYLKEPYKANFFESFAQFDGIKRDVLEGGVRMPTLAYWPQHIKPGLNITSPSMSYDWMPTFVQAAGYNSPVRSDGVSLLPELTGKSGQKKSQVYIEYYEKGKIPNYEEFDPSHRGIQRGQMQMVRLGDTIAVRYNIKSTNDDFEIFDINKDPKQAHNLSKVEDLNKLQSYLKGRVLQMRMSDTSAVRPYDDALIPANPISNLKAGWLKTNYQANTPWISAPETGSKTAIKNLSLMGLSENSVLFEGYIEVPEDGHYTFNLQTQGKSFVRIHNIALLDEDYAYDGKLKSETLNLAKGYHQIKVYFKKVNGKSPSLKLTWSKSGEPAKDISTSIYN